MTQSRFICAVALGVFFVSVPAFADVVFQDSTFNPADYSNFTEPSFSNGLGTITPSQCASCGNPGNALHISSDFGNTISQIGVVAQAFANTNFSYDPSLLGPILSISASVDKNEIIDVTSTNPPFSNTFRPLIEQDGNFYMAAIPGPTNTGGGSTGFLNFSKSGLVATDFLQYDFTSGTFLSGHPNFAGDPMLFGLGQITTIGNFRRSNITLVYDNLNLDIVSTPEPSSLSLLAALLPLLAVGRLARRRKQLCGSR